jgi:hypothetical protein
MRQQVFLQHCQSCIWVHSIMSQRTAVSNWGKTLRYQDWIRMAKTCCNCSCNTVMNCNRKIPGFWDTTLHQTSSLWCLKEHNSFIFKVKQSKKKAPLARCHTVTSHKMSVFVTLPLPDWTASELLRRQQNGREEWFSCSVGRILKSSISVIRRNCKRMCKKI